MKIFPTSSTLTDLVNYINDRTDSHQKVYDFFKNLVLSPNDSASLTVNFTEKNQYFNSKYPIDESGYIEQPQDMFGGKYLPNRPIITSFSRFPQVRTVPNINEGKPEQSVSIDGDIPTSISLTSSTISNLSNSTHVNSEKIKYWPTIKIADFFPISSGMSSVEQDNVNGVTESDSLFSILRIVPNVDEKYHHIDIEYHVNDPKMVLLILLDGKHIVDGNSVEFKVSFTNLDSSEEAHKWPLVLFIDSSYVNIAVENTYGVSTLEIESQSLTVDGISYRFIPAAIMDSYLYQYLRIPSNDSIGYFISLDDLNQLYLNKIGTSNLIKFNGSSNTIKYDNYGYLDSEYLKLDYNDSLNLVTRPIIGKSKSDILNNSEIDFSKGIIKFKTFNNNCAVFGAQTNQYSYNLSTYTTSTTLASLKTVTNYLPTDYPKQVNLDIVNFNSQLESGLFYTFDISSDLIGNNYYIINSGIQFENSFFSIRKHSTSVILEISGTTHTISNTQQNISVNIGYKRVTDSIYKRIVLVANSSLLFDSDWVLDKAVTAYNCDLSSNSSPFIENYQVCDLDLTNATNTVTISNILIFSGLAKAEVDTLFNLSTLNGIYGRFVNTLSPIPKILPVTQLDGLIGSLNQYPKTNIALSGVDPLNATYGNVEYRIGFTAHENKGDFNYRSLENPLLVSNLLKNDLLEEVNLCGDFSPNEVQANIGCDGILNAKLLPYFSPLLMKNSTNNAPSQTPYNSKILNKNTLISFGKCGYTPKVTTETSYINDSTSFIFDNNNDHYYNGVRSDNLQSLKISDTGPNTEKPNLPVRVLSQNSSKVGNTINRLLYYVDPVVTITNKNSTLPNFFNVNYGDTIDTFNQINNPYYTYTISNGYIGTMILAPNVTTQADVLNYKKIKWQLRLITKPINHDTVSFSDINLANDTIVVQTVSSDMVFFTLTHCGMFMVEFDFVGIMSGLTTGLTKYMLNGFLMTLETENINTDGTSITEPRNADYNYLIVSINTYIPDTNSSKISYELAPAKIPPTFTSSDDLTPTSVNNFNTLDSEYVDTFKDFPTINRMMLSTYYQIPKYSK